MTPTVISGASEAQSISPAAVQMLRAWGWATKPPAILVEYASDVVTINPDGKRPIGEIVTTLGLLTEAQIDRALEDKAPDELLLNYLVNNYPKLLANRAKILAIKNHWPFYKRIPPDAPVHDLLQSDAVVRARCDALDALLLLAENTRPLMLFADPDELLRYRQLGGTESLLDPIMKALSQQMGRRAHAEDLWFGLAPRGEIQGPLRQLKSEVSRQGEQSAAGKLFYQERNRGEERRVVIDMLEEGIQRGASDLSMRVLESGEGEIHYRVDSIRQYPYKITADERIAATNYLLQASGAQASGTNLMKPGTGRVFYSGNSGTFEMRCSFLPGNSRDAVIEDDQRISISMRYLSQDEGDGFVDIDRLGFEPEIKKHLNSALNLKDGVVLLVGPTNSGKSTTLAAFLSQHYKLHGDKLKRLSLEDPKERTIRGVEQFSLPSAEVYTDYLEGFLRHDPDVILLSEIRSATTAEVATRAALTGHLVLSTFHASTPVEGYTGLAHLMSADRQYDLLQSLKMIITQRLLPRLCVKCKERRRPTEMEWDVFTYNMTLLGRDASAMPVPLDQIYFPSENGCAHCAGSGYRGLIPVHGILDFTKDVRKHLLKGEFEAVEKMQAFFLEEQSLRALQRGDISLSEASR